jgi:tripartite-type tricarboxylate transporter receptor subunit TctC
VRIITGGSGTFHDIVTRHVAQRLSERWAQSVVVENQGAAALTVGTGMAARAVPDGYTLIMSDRSALAVAPHLYKSVPYDPARDFSPITLAALTPTLLVAHPSVPAANLREFLAYAKSQRPEVHFASAGPGTNNHIAMELLKVATGINAVAIHYKGGGASTQALVSGEVKVGWRPAECVAPCEGRTSQGVCRHGSTAVRRRGGDSDGGGVGTARLRARILDRHARARAHARGTRRPPEQRHLRTAAMRDTLLAQGARPAPGTPEQFAAHIAQESTAMSRLIEATGMRAD